jgi:hypothetical protein
VRSARVKSKFVYQSYTGVPTGSYRRECPLARPVGVKNRFLYQSYIRVQRMLPRRPNISHRLPLLRLLLQHGQPTNTCHMHFSTITLRLARCSSSPQLWLHHRVKHTPSKNRYNVVSDGDRLRSRRRSGENKEGKRHA